MTQNYRTIKYNCLWLSSLFITPLAALSKIHTIHIKIQIKSLTKSQFQQILSTQLF